MDFQKFREGGSKRRSAKFVIEKIDPARIYDLHEMPTHIGLYNGLLSLFVTSSIVGSVMTSRSRFFEIPPGKQSVQLPEYQYHQGVHIYGKIVWK